MNITETNLKKLESLLREGYSFLHKFYPDYKPRTKDEGYFDLMVHSRQFKHGDKFLSWHKQVLTVLDKKIKSDLYAARFEKTAHPNTYTLSGSDGYYWGCKTLESIINEIRKIHYADNNALIGSRTKKVPVRFNYQDPYILLIFDSNNEKYLIHRLRKGAPKDVIELASKRPSLSSVKSDFRSGGSIHQRKIQSSFLEVFRHFLEDEKLKIGKINNFIEITATKIRLNMDRFLVSEKEAQEIARTFKKFG